jgi:L-asparaginase
VCARKTTYSGYLLSSDFFVSVALGNLPSLKDDLIHCLQEASEAGVCVVVMTQCHTGSVIMGHYATGQALRKAGVVSASDMTLVRP